MNFIKILVGYDGSEHALKAIGVGADIARRFGGELLILAVFNPAPLHAIGAFTPGAIVTPRTIERDAQEWQARISLHVREALGKNTPPLRFLNATGNPAEKVLEVAEAEKVDLIVLGSRGLGGFQRLLLGSVSDGIAHHAPCAVLIVR